MSPSPWRARPRPRPARLQRWDEGEEGWPEGGGAGLDEGEEGRGAPEAQKACRVDRPRGACFVWGELYSRAGARRAEKIGRADALRCAPIAVKRRGRAAARQDKKERSNCPKQTVPGPRARCACGCGMKATLRVCLPRPKRGAHREHRLQPLERHRRRRRVRRAQEVAQRPDGAGL